VKTSDGERNMDALLGIIKYGQIIFVKLFIIRNKSNFKDLISS
jgi:hypothetical protein